MESTLKTTVGYEEERKIILHALKILMPIVTKDNFWIESQRALRTTPLFCGKSVWMC